MNLRWTTPAIEAIDDTVARRILIAVRDNLQFVANNTMSKEELVSVGVLKRDINGNYSSTTTSALVAASSASTGILTSKTIDFSISAATTGSGYLNLYLPINTRVIRSWYEVISSFTGSGTPTVGLRVKYDGTLYSDIITATAIATGWNTGLHEGVQTGPASVFSQQMTATRTLEYIVSGGTLLTGRAVIFLQYVTIS